MSNALSEKLNKAICLKDEGNLKQAAEEYKQILKEFPNNEIAFSELLNVFIEDNNFEDALTLICTVLDDEKKSHFYLKLWLYVVKKKDVDEALNIFEKALSTGTKFKTPEIYAISAEYYKMKKCFQKAAEAYISAIEITPDRESYYIDCSEILENMKRHEIAIEILKAGVKFNPQSYIIYSKLGYLCLKINNYDGSIDYCRMAIEINSQCSIPYNNMGLAYSSKRMPEEAIKCFKKSIQMNTQNLDAYYNLATEQLSIGKLKEAIENYNKSIELKPDFADAHYNLGLCYLLLGNFDEGFLENEWRFKRNSQVKKNHPDIRTDKLMWDGKASLENRTILVLFEQGYGDSIQFARFLPVLAEKAGKVVVKIQPKLEKLFERSIQNVEFIKTDKFDEFPYFDTYCFMMSLPYLLKITQNNIPLNDDYLKPDSGKVSIYKEKYFNNEQFKLGIKWKGHPEGKENNTIPLDAFYKLADIQNLKIYSFQTDDGMEELKNIPKNFEIINLGEEFNDFDDTAAAVENLDLVLCNDTSLAHLSGALNKTTWILLPNVPDFRWLIEGNTSKWYNSVRLFRKNKNDDWHSLIIKVKEELLKMV